MGEGSGEQGEGRRKKGRRAAAAKLCAAAGRTLVVLSASGAARPPATDCLSLSLCLQCAELQCYILPLAAILNKLRAGRYRDRKWATLRTLPTQHGSRRSASPATRADNRRETEKAALFRTSVTCNIGRVGVSSSHKYFLCVCVCARGSWVHSG